MKHTFFFDRAHAHFYLKDNVVRLAIEDCPVLILEVLSLKEIRYIRLPYGDTGTCQLSDVLLDSLPLGFFSQDGDVFMSYRLPKRAWAVGLHDDNVAVVRLNLVPVPFSLTQVREIRDFCRMLMGDPPLKRVRDDTFVISRRLAVVNGKVRTVTHKNIGTWKGKINLHPKFMFLKERFEQEIENAR